MQFKHPEILYALFLLLIPIFIHLFQLRKFQKIDFTNVAFLKKAILQTRKSSVIKKWLTLFMRLLAFACLIIAFAQPFKPERNTGLENEVVLYIDNSFSTQAKGPKGSLLEGSLQDLFHGISADRLSWFTNNSENRNSSKEDFKTEILKVRHTSADLTPNEVLLKAGQLFSKRKDSQKKLIYISDFRTNDPFPKIPDDLEVEAVSLKPSVLSNISIDSAFIKSRTTETAELAVRISAQGNTPRDVSVSLYKNNELIAKTGIQPEENSEEDIVFDIDISDGFIGRIELTEPHITFDNTLFFSINKTKKINVLSISQDDGNFIDRLFDSENFNLLRFEPGNLEYQHIPNQNLIILNGLKEIPSSLTTALKSYLADNRSLLIIPSKNSDINSYNQLLSQINAGMITGKIEQQKKITKIIFSHPLFSDVFEKEISNFQYPKVESFIDIQSNATPVLNFEDNKPFLLQHENMYLFTASLDSENSNFINSPLIVPVLYNMGLQSLPLPDLYLTIGKQNIFGIPVETGPDEILTFHRDEESFIPLQQRKSNYVEITTDDLPEVSGNYRINRKDEFVQYISYNYPREQGKLEYADPKGWKGIRIHNSIPEVLSFVSNEDSTQQFWKWFAIFAGVFLMAEMLILKFLK